MANRDRIQSTLWRRLRGVLGVPVAVLLAVAVPGTAAGQSRLKDNVEFEGVRDNMLVGYGLVVGLNGTGDNLANAPFTQQSLVGMLERLGVNTRDELKNLKTQNVAAVVVIATLPPFARQVVRIVDGETSEGRHHFIWDGNDGQGIGVPANGVYSLSLNAIDADGNPVEGTAIGIVGKVNEVVTEGGDIILMLGGTAVPLDRVVAIRSTSNG